MKKENIMNSIESNEKNDLIELTTNTLISTLPYIGGSLNCIISFYQQKRHRERLIVFIRELYNDLKDRIDKIEYDKIENDDFIDIFENTLCEVIKNRHESKRKALRNIILNTITNKNFSFDESEYLVKIVIDLPIKHLFVLHELFFVNFTRNYSENAEKTINTIGQKLNCSIEEIFEIVKDLENENLSIGLTTNYTSRGNRGGLIMPDIQSYLTEKGLKLLKIITNDT